jgi:hypothetical protein
LPARASRPHRHSKLLAFLYTAATFNGLTWKDDEMPWCGGFVATCLLAAGVEPGQDRGSGEALGGVRS